MQERVRRLAAYRIEWLYKFRLKADYLASTAIRTEMVTQARKYAVYLVKLVARETVGGRAA